MSHIGPLSGEIERLTLLIFFVFGNFLFFPTLLFFPTYIYPLVARFKLSIYTHYAIGGLYFLTTEVDFSHTKHAQKSDALVIKNGKKRTLKLNSIFFQNILFHYQKQI